MFTTLVNYIENKKNVDAEYNFEKFKTEFENTNLLIKEQDDLAIVYYENMGYPITCLEQMTRSCIIDTKTMTVLVSQQNNIVYNETADTILKEYAEYKERSFDDLWSHQVVVEECVEGTLISLFYHNDKWYLSTRRCIDASTSRWGTKSYSELFYELLDKDIESHDKTHSYVYILVHNENNNIVRRDSSENRLILCSEMKVGTLEETKQTANPALNYSYERMKSELSKMDARDRKSKMVSCEGFIAKLYEGELYKSNYMILKYQTDLYTKIAAIKPNVADMKMVLCGLYQQDKLFEYGKFITRDAALITSIPQLFKDLSNCLLSIYRCTRNKKNPEFYDNLGLEFKKSLYQLHGKFVERCKVSSTTAETQVKKQITIHDVYYYIKSKPIYEFSCLYTEYCNNEYDKLEIPSY